MSDQSTPPPAVAPPISLPESERTGRMRAMQWQCPRCGSNDLASAYLIDYSFDKFRQLRLVPKALKLRRLTRMLRPFKNMVNVSAQVCRDCGLVMLEVNPEEFRDAEERYGRR